MRNPKLGFTLLELLIVIAIPILLCPNLALALKAFARVDCIHESALRSQEVGRLSGGDSLKNVVCGVACAVWRDVSDRPISDEAMLADGKGDRGGTWPGHRGSGQLSG